MSGQRMRRFCMVTTFYPPASFGGDGVFVRQLAHELVARGHEVDVVYSADAFRTLGGRVPPGAPADEPEGLRLHALSAGAGALGPLLIQQSGRPVLLGGELRQLFERPFDVVHFHNISLVGGPGVLRYGGGAVKLYTTHEAWLVCPTHTLYRFGRAPCVRPHCLACSLVHRRPPQWWRYLGVLRRAARHVDAFLAPSSAIVRIHRERGLNLPFFALPSFVADRTEAPADELHAGTGDGERPFFLFAGRLERLKGVHTLLPIFERLGEADLVIAGAGSQASALRRAATSGNVRFVGRVEPDRLVSLYRRAVAVIVPSLALEVFPLVALEALREGTPIVVPDRDPLTEIVEESGGGLIYRGDAGLSTALRRLLAHPAERDRLGAAGQQAWRARWTAEVHLERYFRLIERIEAARSGGRAARTTPG